MLTRTTLIATVGLFFAQAAHAYDAPSSVFIGNDGLLRSNELGTSRHEKNPAVIKIAGDNQCEEKTAGVVKRACENVRFSIDHK